MKPIKYIIVSYVKDNVVNSRKVTNKIEIDAMLNLKAKMNPQDIKIKVVR